jgi:hypothetical protein
MPERVSVRESGLRGRAVGVAKQLGDDVRRLLAAGLGDAFESLGVLALNADEDDQLRIGVALAVFDVAWIELCQIYLHWLDRKPRNG